MKTLLENAIRQIIFDRKLFYLNLFKGNEKCIQGDLFANLNLNPDVNAALEFPIGNKEHADIALFTDSNYNNLKSIVELKHYSPHQTNPEQSSVREIKKEIKKRFENNIESVYVIQILTQIVNVANQDVLTKYPFTRTYANNEANITNVITNNIINLVYNTIKNEIDNGMRFVSSSYQIDSEIVVSLHFFICGPLQRSKLFKNKDIDETNLPINPAHNN